MKNIIFPKCIDCGKTLSAKHCKRCNKCKSKGKNNPMFGNTEYKGLGNPNFRHGQLVKRDKYCSRCKVKIVTLTANLCAHCKSWKGTQPLTRLLRNCVEYISWRTECFKRDNYTCQECNVRGGEIEVHHKKSFSVILGEFLQLYNQFSPIEDKETLLRLALSYLPFWEINNGQTLCVKCHKKTENYGSKGRFK